MTPVFAHGSLRLYLLNLLAQSPKHGYELIQALTERFGGTYSPSAGTIYPRLAKLEEEGLVTKTVDGRKTIYAITDAGLVELEQRGEELADLEDELTDSVRRLADEVRSGVNDALRTLRAELASASQQASRNVTEVAPDMIRGRSSRAAAHSELRAVEGVLNEFRQRVRAELRVQAAHDTLPEDIATVLRTELDGVRHTLDALPHRQDGTAG